MFSLCIFPLPLCRGNCTSMSTYFNLSQSGKTYNLLTGCTQYYEKKPNRNIVIVKRMSIRLHKNNSTLGAARVEANLPGTFAVCCIFFITNQWQDNIWPWKWGSKSKSIIFTMLPFDGEHQPVWNSFRAFLRRLTPFPRY